MKLSHLIEVTSNGTAERRVGHPHILAGPAVDRLDRVRVDAWIEGLDRAIEGFEVLANLLD
jgi:hypothetical protein